MPSLIPGSLSPENDTLGLAALRITVDIPIQPTRAVMVPYSEHVIDLSRSEDRAEHLPRLLEMAGRALVDPYPEPDPED